MMHEIGIEPPIDRPHRENAGEKRQRVEAATLPGHGMQTESFGRDRRAALLDLVTTWTS